MPTIHFSKTAFSRSTERTLLTGVSILLLLLLVRLYVNLRPQLQEAEQAYTAGTTIQLDAHLDKKQLRQMLLEGNYVESDQDLTFLVSQLSSKLQTVGELDNLGALNKKSFSIQANEADTQGGSLYHSNFLASLYRLGFDSTLYANELRHPHSYPVVVNLGAADGYHMQGEVINYQTQKPLKGVLVRLQQHIPQASQRIPIVQYARTDEHGNYTFEGLPPHQAYSVLPLLPGYEFGMSQGTSDLGSNKTRLDFKAKPHTMRLLDGGLYQQLKDNNAFTVRTPRTFRSQLAFWSLLLLGAFWLVHVGWVVRRFEGDMFLLPLIMLLSGLSFLMMISIQDPLRDTFRADDVVQGILLGLGVLFLLSQANVARFYVSRYFDPLATRFIKTAFQPIGWTWLLTAFSLMALVVLFGTGPEGSGVKVNLSILGVSFQPSEITKLLVVVFFAGYFAANAEWLRHVPSIRWRLQNNLRIFVGFVLLLGIYLLLGDMGPALVLCLTFLIFYAVARNELAILIAGVSLYALLLWGLSRLVDSHDKLTFSAATFLYLAAWWAYGSFKKDFKETPLFGVLLIAAFVFGESLPFGFAQRLADRNDMFRNLWDNQLYGGDQVAHGVWALSSGGWFGQGLGKGAPQLIPANHTDMILPSIGEELGWMGLLAIFISMGVLLHRSLLIARRAGQPFAFYLCAGIAVVTGVQFLLIALGSIGSLPLTGISVPLLSYGKVAMALQIGAFGIILGVSNRAGVPVQQQYIQQQYDTILVTGSMAFSVSFLYAMAVLAYYQVINANELVVKPALVVSRMGERIFSYNPRIHLLTRHIEAGTIYDRNGYVLATSQKSLLKIKKELLLQAGAQPAHLKKLLSKRLTRYYPFGNQLLFWTGDYNKRLLWNETNGYAAEYRHLAALRGFETKPTEQVTEVTALAKAYQEERFLPPTTKVFTLTQYDYKALAPLLRAGLDSKAVADFKAKPRDITLTVDATLQTHIQQMVASSNEFNDKRISVVMLNAASGEVLASATNPLPSPQTLRQLAEIPKEYFQKIFNERFKDQLLTERDLGMTYATPPGSTAKILTAFAALNRLGTEGATTTYEVTEEEIIRKSGTENEPTGSVDMRRAIVNSSNIYFIRLANEHSLDREMQQLYDTIGMRLAQRGGYFFENTASPTQLQANHAIWQREVFAKNRSFYVQPSRQGKRSRYNSEFSGIAWGQGQLETTPLALARMAGIIANEGKLQPSRFVLKQAQKAVPKTEAIPLAKQHGISSLLKGFMTEQSSAFFNGLAIAGKTGTPQRLVNHRFINDGWYVFFADSPKLNAPLVVCIRIEGVKSSAKAVALAQQLIVPELQSLGYF